MKNEIKFTIEYKGGKATHTFPYKERSSVMDQVAEYIADFKRKVKAAKESE